MASTIRPLLPPLHDSHRVPPVPSGGAWHELGSDDMLQVIARGLNTGEALRGTSGDIVSVPDVWAQLTVFHDALIADTHPLHGRAVGEWRGLLACFALAAYQPHAKLTCQLVRLSGLADGRWANIARRLPPQAALLGGRQLDEVGLVRIESHLVALAQPLTLLAPSRSLADLRGERQLGQWLQGSHFADPLSASRLSADERTVLARFLETLCEDLSAAQDGGHDLSALLGLARSFRQETVAKGLAPGARFEQVPARLELPGLSVFRAFTRHERISLAGGTPSDCLLRLRPGLTGPLRGIVLADPELDRKLGRPSSAVRVWGHVTLRHLQEKPELVATVRSEAQAEGYLVVGIDQLFLPKLYGVDGVEGEQGFGQHPPGARNLLLPLSPMVLALLDRAELAQACRVAGPGSGGTTVDLRLPLTDGSAVTLSKHYDSVDSSEPPFALSVWPNFSAPWWNLQLGYSGATTGIQFVTAGLVSLEGIRRSLLAEDGFTAVSAAAALLSGNVSGLSATTWFRQDRENASALFELPGSAEAAVLEDRRNGGLRAAGLLLLPEPAAAPSGGAGRSARIGIDFGTTNTAVYMQVGTSEPEPVRIEPRHILAYRLAEQSRDELDAELLPTSRVDVPFQTILRDRLMTSADRRRRPFRDTLIYFAQRRRVAIGKASVAGNDIFGNLKWAEDPAARQRIELFLTQAVILALAEAGARGIEPGQVSFRFSFPEAFRPTQYQSFAGAARNAVRLGTEAVAGKASDPAAPEPGFQTESASAAQYFIQRLRVPPTEGLITFDIGGQTTDVAVVQSQSVDSERLVWRGSFQLAGRHLLIEHLCENRAVLEELASKRPDLADLLAGLPPSGKASEARVLATELLVNSPAFADAVVHDLPALGGTPGAERLRAVALSGLAGLFDYLGRTVRHLAGSGLVEPRANTAVAICLGGRASLLFKALLRSEEEQQLLLGFFTAAAGEAQPRARLVFSDAPKQEVAYGLVRDDGAVKRAGASQPLLGEAVSYRDRRAPAASQVYQLELNQPWRIEDPVEFRRFVGRLPELRVRPALPDTALSDLTGLANADILRSLTLAQAERAPDGSQPDTSEIEPPFIVLLRHFVHRLATDPRALR